MAANMTQEMAVAEATAWKQRIALVVKTVTELQAMIARNGDMAIDWSNGDLYSGGGDITTDGSGNIDGLSFTPAQLSNAIGSVDWLVKLMTNQDLTGIPQADHLGNLNLVAQADSIRPDRV